MLFRTLADPRFLSPFEALRSVQADLGWLLGDEGRGRSTPMPLALYSRDHGLLLRVALPGLEAQDVSIEIDGDALTLSGAWKTDPEGESAEAKHVERPRGAFTRTLRLPFEIEVDEVQARMQNGVLEIELPRAKKSLPKRITIRTEPRS